MKSVKAADAYKILNSYLKEEFKLLSYKKFKHSKLGWHKLLNAKYLVFSFQCNRRGWDYYIGSDVLIYIELYENVSESSIMPLEQARLRELLETQDLQELVHVQNYVINKFHPYDWDVKKAFPSASQEFLECLEKQFEPVVYPPSHYNVEHIRYYDEDDLHKWGEYLCNNLRNISTRIENKWRNV